MAAMDRDSELALVRRLRASDPGAFDDIHAEFNSRLFNFLARLSRRREVAEDLLEETWMRLIDSAPRLRDDTRLGPYLFTVARNLYISYCRSRSIEDEHASALLGLWPSGSPGPSPIESTIARETGERIDEALVALPAKYREALLLVAFEELRPAEAAVVCGITPEAMRQRISRARTMLAHRLEALAEQRLLALREATT